MYYVREYFRKYYWNTILPSKDSQRYALFRQSLGIDDVIQGHESPDGSDPVVFHVDGGDRKVTYCEIILNLQILVVSDVHEATDVVYMVAKSPLLKRIIVIFRGSSTTLHYQKDFKVLMATIPNPLPATPEYEYYDREEDLGVHWGFRDYLYQEESLFEVGTLPKIFKKFINLLDLRKSISTTPRKKTTRRPRPPWRPKWPTIPGPWP